MPTLDDDPDVAAVAPPGDGVQDMLSRARHAKYKRTRDLGERAQAALERLDAALLRESAIADHEVALARLRRGED